MSLSSEPYQRAKQQEQAAHALCTGDTSVAGQTLDNFQHDALSRQFVHSDKESAAATDEALFSIDHKDISQRERNYRLLGESSLIHTLNALAQKLAQKKLSVLIQGESGTGKEVLARFIHQQSSRAAKPFFAINCAAIPENMLESLLFGYEKGVFTGAHKAHAGKFEQANGSTLLLDEVSEMPLDLQAKLLRVLQEKEVERLGATRPSPVDVRLIASCNKSLQACVRAGEFREDLYFRLSVFPLQIPSLKERLEDIPILTQHFLQSFSEQKNSHAGISQQALQLLLKHQWPGNVRELENVIQRALLLSDDHCIQTEHIYLDELALKPAAFLKQQSDVSNLNLGSSVDSSTVDEQGTTSTELDGGNRGEHIRTEALTIRQRSADKDQAISDLSVANVVVNDEKAVNTPESLEENIALVQQVIDETQDMTQNLLFAEREMIAKALEATASKKAAANKLGISPRTLRYKLAKFKEQGMALHIKRDNLKGRHYVE